MIATLISAFELGLSMFVANLFASRVSYSNVYKPLMLFFIANSLVLLCFIIRDPVVHGPDFSFLPELVLFKLIIELCLPPLVWIYIRELSSEQARGFKSFDWLHFIFPLAPCVFISALIPVLFGVSEASLRAETFGFVARLSELLNIVALIQFCLYAAFIMFRLAAYRRKLMDMFSSTENIELRWFCSILILFLLAIGLEAIAEVRYALTQQSNPFTPWNGLIRLLIIWILATWGLRQQPALKIELDKAEHNSTILEKYEKSAIPTERLQDIALKIKDFLESRKGYRDADLSLRTMAETIGVRPDYVSQTLNREIGESFFDYVNRLRTQEAMVLITRTDNTIVEIANAVGFNSRSSFYTAFKKETGCTPTAYRKKMK